MATLPIHENRTPETPGAVTTSQDGEERCLDVPQQAIAHYAAEVVRHSVRSWQALRSRVKYVAEEYPLQFVAGVALAAFSTGVLLRITLVKRQRTR